MNLPQSPHRFILSGGGTGGHIFPALAIAEAIRAREPEADILFIGARNRMEMEKVPAAGYPIEGLWISGFQRKLSIRNLIFPLKLIWSLFQAWKIIRRFKPDVVIGTGGFASGPTLRIASLLNIPTLIQEQNSYPGITNKMLGSKVDRICVSYENLEKYFPAEKIVLTGNPVRKDLLSLEGKEPEARNFFQLSPEKKTVLVIGGSLGALTINESVRESLDLMTSQDIQVIWQTGKGYYASACECNHHKGLRDVKVHPFIQRMDLAYAAADLIVSRAGAIAISELCIVGKPCILIPSPNVAEDHQTKNAKALAEKEAAILLADKDARNQLGQLILSTLADTGKSAQLSEKIKTLAHPDATIRIASQVFDLIKPAG